MSMSFLTPVGALLALLVIVPIAAALGRERRRERIRGRLGLAAPRCRLGTAFLPSVVALFTLVGAAATQPVLDREDRVSTRTDAEAFFLFDSSRSMLAAPAVGAPTRFERATALGLRIRAAVPEVPAGVASMTDRPLPHLFPTADHEAFAAVVERAIGVDLPPPAKPHPGRATDFDVLVSLGRENFFGAESVKRLVVLFTDGESLTFDPQAVALALERAGVLLVTVRLWDAEERIFRPDGGADPAYRPGSAGSAELERLAVATGGGRVFGEDDAAAVLSTVRDYLGEGPRIEALARTRSTALGPYLLLTAGVPLAALLVRLPGSRRRTQGDLHTVWSSRWRAFSRTVGRRSSRAQASPRPS